MQAGDGISGAGSIPRTARGAWAPRAVGSCGRLRPRAAFRGRSPWRSTRSSPARRRRTAPSSSASLRSCPGTTWRRAATWHRSHISRGQCSDSQGTRSRRSRLPSRRRCHEDWSDSQTMTDFVLLPAACYPVYPWVASAGRRCRAAVGSSTCSVTASATSRRPILHVCKRSDSARTSVSAQPEDVAAWHHSWIDRGLRAARLDRAFGNRQSKRTTRSSAAAAGCLRRASASRASSWSSSTRSISDASPTAIMSINYHQDHFGSDFGIVTADGRRRTYGLLRLRARAHHACALPDARARARRVARRDPQSPPGLGEDALP